MTLVDSSAWIELWRATGSRVHQLLRELVGSSEALLTTEPVVMELLAGVRDDAEDEIVRRTLAGCRLIRVVSLRDWRRAAAIYAEGRRRGQMVRRHVDCLISAVAIRASVPVLAKDRDYEVIAGYTPLQLAR
jgi:predicted nucleic acid-binding protein